MKTTLRQQTLLRLATFALATAPGWASAGLNPISYGFKAGITSTGTNQAGTSSGLGYMAGIGLDIGAGPLGVMADIYYAKRKISDVDGDLSLTQIFVPVQARYSLIPMLQVTGGGYYASGIGDVTFSDASNSVSQSYADAGLRRTDYGLTAGLGFSLPIGVGSLVLEARYNWGLADISGIEGTTINTRSVDFVAGILY